MSEPPRPGLRKEDPPATDVFAAIRELAPAIRGRASEIEKARRLPADLAQSLARLGLFRMAVPREIGRPRAQ
jgi:indole-3-acetate monooxygenase